MNLVDACKRYAGIDIPVFCYHPKLGHDGNCRMCLVELATPRKNAQTGEMELAWFPTLQTACTQRVSDGMAIRTLSRMVQDGRREILEFLLSSHPLDCPICDKGGECPLQNLTMAHGPGASRMYWDEKMRLGKHIPLGEIIYLDQERCIQCQRCIRFQDDIAGDHVLDFNERGRYTRIITSSTPGFDSVFSGNTTDICPVGALTSADFRFNARPWEMVQVATICSHCPVGCNMTFDTRTERDEEGRTVIKRVMPRQNEQVNEIWICDKGRFTHHHMDHADRLTTPLIRRGGKLVSATWEEALEAIAGYVREAGPAVGAIAGGRLSNEDFYTLQKLVRSRGSNDLATYPEVGGGQVAAQFGVAVGADLQQLGKGDVIIVANTDLYHSGPVWYLRVIAAAKRGAALITINSRVGRIDQYATHSLTTVPGEEAAALNALSGGKKSKGSDTDKAAAEALAAASNVVIFVGQDGFDRARSEAFAASAANLLASTGQPDSGLIIVWPEANGQGGSDMGFSGSYGPGYQAVEHAGRGYDDILSALAGDLGVLFIAGANPVFDDPAAEHALRDTKATIIVQDHFLTETAQLADIVLPTQTPGERDGTYTSGERRVQRFYPAVEPVGESMPDWWIAQAVEMHLGQLERPARSAAAVMLEIAQAVPQYAGITYQKLAQVVEQFPDVGGDDMYYGGTAYQNRHGLGVQLPLVDTSGVTPGISTIPAGERIAAKGQTALLPVKVLYDQEPLFVIGAPVLRERLAQPVVDLSPADAARLKVETGDLVEITFAGRALQATARVDAGVTDGVAVIPFRAGSQAAPRSTVAAQIVKLERVGA